MKMNKMFSLFFLMIPSILFSQMSNSVRLNDHYYDYSLTVNCEEELLTDDYKFIINPENNRNTLYYITYSYRNDTFVVESRNGMSRVPIDTVISALTIQQVDSVYKYAKKLFTIPSNPVEHDSNKFYPPMIFDGMKINVTLKIDRIVYSANAFDTYEYLDYKNLVEKLNKIRTGH